MISILAAETEVPPTVAPTSPCMLQNPAAGDIVKQQNAVAKYQKEAKKKQRGDKALGEACVQYALSVFLRDFARLLITFGQPAGSIFSVLADFTGLGYGGLSPQGDAYLNAYCCNMVRSSGISFAVGDNGIVTAGPISIDLGALLGVPAGAAGMAAAPITAALGALTSGAFPGAVPGAGPDTVVLGAVPSGVAFPGATLLPGAVSPGGVPGTAILGTSTFPGAVPGLAGAGTCTILDWLAFALQGDQKLMKRFTDLLTAALKLEVRLFTDALNGAARAGTAASRILERAARTGTATAAAGGDLTLGAVLDAVTRP
ncbi:hypothetical protein VaNZ11_015512 [Volvox africanus]|uniref:Uncharacterized protein n=1 Tax=Volvox africanus TaxID=51714 RepID=A0ABQ5SLR6_9CHLO|nr:hypothetical protein VaNZ11_015512 [Volvox africanus]